MVDLGPGQKPVVMTHYPHMLAEDIGVWSKYLRAPIVPILKLWYDIHVGGGIEVRLDATEIEKGVALGVGRKRIDVVCKVGGGYWVVEIKPFASMLAVGQALCYTRLFTSAFYPDGDVFPVVVCDSADEDLRDAYDDFGVAVIVND